jgi:hypothetical protein
MRILLRMTRYPGIGIASLFLAGCATPSVILQCPPIPASLTTPCEPEPRPLETNGDLARAYMDARECVALSNLRLAVIRELSDCREQPR